MPANLVETATFPSPVVAPIGGEARTAESVSNPLQQLTSRDAYLKAQIERVLLAADSGVRILYSVATLAALKALGAAVRSDRMVCYVASPPTLYFFDILSTAASAPPAVVQPDDAPGGLAGRWFASSYGLLGQPYGIPQLDAQAREPAGLGHYGNVYVDAVDLNQPMTAGTFTEVPGSAFTVPGLLPNDLARLDFGGQNFGTSSVTGFLNVQPQVTLPDGSTVLPANMLYQLAGAGSGAASLGGGARSGFYRVSQSGTHIFRLVAQITGGAGTGNVQSSFQIQVTRP